MSMILALQDQQSYPAFLSIPLPTSKTFECYIRIPISIHLEHGLLRCETFGMT